MCKISGSKIWSCKIFDKSHLCGQGDGADVEDPAGEEEGEEGAEGLDKVDLVLQGLPEPLAACGGLLLLLLVVEGEQLGADLDHHQEAHLGDIRKEK